MLIYDSFVDLESAKKCQVKLQKKFYCLSIITEDPEQARFLDPFPFELTPPILLVQRPIDDNPEIEKQITDYIIKNGGQFAGT